MTINIEAFPRDKAEAAYADILAVKNAKDRLGLMRGLAEADLYFMLIVILRRPDLRHDFFYRCIREVEAEPNGCLDLWAREHAKSSIITFGLTLQDLCKNVEERVAILSYNRPAAKKQLLPIRDEMEQNPLLPKLWPHVFWSDPRKEAPQWSMDDGLVLKRTQARREPTIGAWGLVDGQPVGSHFSLRVYDDVVTDGTVSEGMLEKTTLAWRASAALGERGGRFRMAGTFWSRRDTYYEILKSGAAKPRIKPCYQPIGFDGFSPKFDGQKKPVLMSEQELDQKRVEMGEQFAPQMLLDPGAESEKKVTREHFRYYRRPLNADHMTVQLICDPADSQKRRADYTCIMVVGLSSDQNRYVLDVIIDRLSLSQRAAEFMRLHREWQPNDAGWEKYGKDADISYVREKMNGDAGTPPYHFTVIELNRPRSGKGDKESRIGRAVPDFEQGRWYFPEQLHYVCADGKTRDMVEILRDQWLIWPHGGGHDDGPDCQSRSYDLPTPWPENENQRRRRGGPRVRNVGELESEWDLFAA